MIISEETIQLPGNRNKNNTSFSVKKKYFFNCSYLCYMYAYIIYLKYIKI